MNGSGPRRAARMAATAAQGGMTIRDAAPGEAAVLEGLQRRSSDVWEAFREQLAANPDAIELPQAFLDGGWVRVAVGPNHEPVGFAVVIPAEGAVRELDGLFVEPARMRRGVGRALVEDAASRARASGALRLQVTAGPASGFYEKVGFSVLCSAVTRFGSAVRMCRDL